MTRVCRAMEAELKERDKARDEKKNAVRRKVQAMSGKWKEVNGLVRVYRACVRYHRSPPIQDEDAEDLKNRLDRLKRSEKDRANQIKRLERTVEEIREKLAHPPKTENLEDINNEIVRQLDMRTS